MSWSSIAQAKAAVSKAQNKLALGEEEVKLLQHQLCHCQIVAF
jgi:hypothetical protein